MVAKKGGQKRFWSEDEKRSIRPIALGRKNDLFMGFIGGGKAAAIANNTPTPKRWEFQNRVRW
jgi:hypothetical protein